MKRIYLLVILLMAISANVFAQRNCNLRPGPIYIGTAAGSLHKMVTGEKILVKDDGTSIYYIEYGIINNGTAVTDSFKSGDTLMIKDIPLGRNLRFIFSGTASLTKTDTIYVYPIPASGGSSHKPDTLGVPGSISSTTTISNFQWCDSVWAKPVAANGSIVDPQTDNRNCTTVEVTYLLVGINTVTGAQEGFLLFPNPATSQLNIKFDFGSGAASTVLMRDVTGRIILQRDLGTLYGQQQIPVDVSKLAPGMYTAELMYGDQRIVSQVSIK